MKGCSHVEVVTMDNGITAIGASAFEGCTTLHTVKFSSNITSIGAKAFYGCNVLQEIDLTEIKACPEFGEKCFGEWSEKVKIKVPISWYWQAMKKDNFKEYNGRIYCESVEKGNTRYIGNYILVRRDTNNEITNMILGDANTDFNDVSYELIAGKAALVTESEVKQWQLRR